ncbi:recombinase family protein, partial [Escherichia coli]|uniref:recombinase family protein n=1 Tax=Escherichia coli TaxID=562 RepID=UPI003313BB69
MTTPTSRWDGGGISTNHQDTELQRLALESAGCERIYEEYASGRTANRPVLK